MPTSLAAKVIWIRVTWAWTKIPTQTVAAASEKYWLEYKTFFLAESLYFIHLGGKRGQDETRQGKTKRKTIQVRRILEKKAR